MSDYLVFLNYAAPYSLHTPPAIFTEGAEPLAVVSVEAGGLDAVWCICQHGSHDQGTGNWTEHPQVTLCSEYDKLFVRSMMVGDVIKDPDGIFWVVDYVGFKECDVC